MSTVNVIKSTYTYYIPSFLENEFSAENALRIFSHPSTSPLKAWVCVVCKCKTVVLLVVHSRELRGRCNLRVAYWKFVLCYGAVRFQGSFRCTEKKSRRPILRPFPILCENLHHLVMSKLWLAILHSVESSAEARVAAPLLMHFTWPRGQQNRVQ